MNVWAYRPARNMGCLILPCLMAVAPPLCRAASQDTGSIGFQVNAAHTGNLKTLPSFAPPLKALWAVDLGGPVSYPIVADGMVFVTVSDVSNYGSQIYALNAADGSSVWHKAIGGTYFESYLTYENGVIYDLNFDGLLQAYDAKTGRSVWSIQIPDQYAFETPPIASGSSIYVTGAGSGGTIYQINGATGAVNWIYGTDAGGGTPAVAHGSVLVGDGCDTYALAEKTGKLVWHDNGNCSGGVSGYAAIIGKFGFVPWFNGNQSGAVLGLKTGVLKDAIGNAVAAFYDKLAIQVQGNMTATRFGNGNIAWSFAPNDTLNVPPIVVNGVAYALSSSGNLYAVSADSGALLQTLQPGVGKNSSEGAPVMPGLGAGPGLLLVPSVSLLTAYGP